MRASCYRSDREWRLSGLGVSVLDRPDRTRGDRCRSGVLYAAATPEAEPGSGQQQDQENDDDDCEHVTS